MKTKLHQQLCKYNKNGYRSLNKDFIRCRLEDLVILIYDKNHNEIAFLQYEILFKSLFLRWAEVLYNIGGMYVETHTLGVEWKEYKPK